MGNFPGAEMEWVYAIESSEESETYRSAKEMFIWFVIGGGGVGGIGVPYAELLRPGTQGAVSTVRSRRADR